MKENKQERSCEICGEKWKPRDYKNYLELDPSPTLSADIYSKHFNYCIRCYGRIRKGFLPTQIIEQLKQEKSKEVESGYEQEQRKLFNLIYDIKRSEVVGELLNEAIQLALKEGERRAIEKVKELISLSVIEHSRYKHEDAHNDFCELLLSELSNLKEGQ
jgi:hypothetical protein